MDLTFDQILSLTNNELGQHDVACPECGPDRSTKANQKRKVLRVWLKKGFASYGCARCGIRGYARDSEQPTPQSQPRPRLAEQGISDEAYTVQQHRKALYFWSCSQPINGTPAETYLRHRSVTCALPNTLRYLTPRKAEHHPAMIAPFGLPEEPEPGVLRMRANAVRGVHLTMLAPDGQGKAGTGRDKIMVGPSNGWPIVLTPTTDGLGLGIAEGIETAISMHMKAGIGVWAAGCASRLPGLGDKVPSYVEVVTLALDDDPAGQRKNMELAERLHARGIEVRMTEVHDGA